MLLLDAGRYLLPRLGVLVQAQLLVGGAFVGVGPGALLSAAGFSVVVVVAWLER